MNAEVQSRTNPYVGPRAFQRGEHLYGRDREIMELVDLLIAERIVLLYSPSGAGKTSLIQAALIPELEKEGFDVLPVMRVGLDPPQSIAQSPGESPNRFVLSLLLSLEGTRAANRQLSLAELGRLTLSDYLDRRDDPESIVLVFDQFEEILTLDPTDLAAKAEFFDQVGAALRDRHRWALFSMREEFLARLDPYLRYLPTRLSTTCRLDLLGQEAALLAIQQPARDAGIDFDDAAARALVDDLCQVRVLLPDGSTEPRRGAHVEPVQLQVVCYRMWERLPEGATHIVETDIKDVGDVDSALAAYYAERVEAIAKQVDVSERTIRDWFDHHLITEQGVRGQVLQGPDQSQGLDNRVIRPLVDAHLVRPEARRGVTWLELAHDRLIKPVRDNNAAWREGHLGTMQRQAALWQDENMPDGLLLHGPALDEARAWAEAHQDDLTDLDAKFLEESEKARRLHAATRLRLMLVGAAVLLAILAGLSVLAGYNAWNAGRQEQAALAARDAEAAARQTADQAKGEALIALDAAIVAQQTADEAKAEALIALDAESAARQTAEANYFWAVTSVAETGAGLSEASKFAALSLDRAGTIQALEATNQALSTRHFARPTMSFASRTPIPTPGGGTPSATRWPTSTSPPTATGTATPNFQATAAAELATALALQAQLAQIQMTQTAVARCSTEPLGEFADLWQAEEVRGRLGCPKSSLPAKGAFAEQPFERGYMYWAESSDLFIVTVGGETGIWHLFFNDEIDWPVNMDGPSCQPEVQPKGGQVQPVRGFGGLWCAREDIRDAIGFGTVEEYEVEGNLLQQFERGWILRDSRGIVHILFKDDGTYVQQNPQTDMVFVPGGQFLMGSPAGEGEDDEHPQHSVFVLGFWLDRFEVTNADYQKCVAAQVCDAPHRQDGTAATRSATRTDYFGNARFDQFPVVFVSWKDARTYCQWVGKRLPTEAEWEWAAGGSKGSRFPWGDQDPSASLAAYDGQVSDTQKVGTYKPNALGLYDMAGNVWEWTNSLYLAYPYLAYDGREAEKASDRRVLRGGSWRDGPLALRTANRDAGIDPDFPLDNVGFRCARSVD